jgi:transposase
MRILAIDLGKFRSTAVLGVHSRRVAETHRDFETSADRILQLAQRTRADLVVIEICPFAGLLCDTLSDAGIRVAVVNTSHDRYLRRDIRAKTDLKDAIRLLEMAHEDPDGLPTVHVPDRATRQWRRQIAFRSILQQRLVMAKNSLRAILASADVHLPRSNKAWSKQFRAELEAITTSLGGVASVEASIELEQIGMLERHLATHTASLDEVGKSNPTVQLLKTAYGVGPRVAEVFAAWIADPRRFRNGKQVGAYFGLVPRVHQSGQSCRHGSITRSGSSHARWMLVQAAWVAVRKKESWARHVYERAMRGSKVRKRVALIAVARRLAVRLWAMMKRNEAWREDASESATASPPHPARAASSADAAGPMLRACLS